jgi:hypothetical protein
MTVRKTSALPDPFCGDISRNADQKARKNGPNQAARISPKAKVRGSNPLGRATSDMLSLTLRTFVRGFAAARAALPRECPTRGAAARPFSS